MNRGMAAALTLGVVLALAGCGSKGNGGDAGASLPSNPQQPTESGQPLAEDAFEGSGGDDTVATARALSVGVTEQHTIFPAGDVDVVKLTLAAGLAYEFSANRLNYNGDTQMVLLASDGVSVVLTNDDYVALDSRIRYTPSANGIYYLKVTSLNQGNGIAGYVLSTRTFTDADADGFSPFYDCNDASPNIYPRATEIAGDGIDQDCDGVDRLAGTTADAGEPDDTIMAARAMLEVTMAPWEMPANAGGPVNARTLHASGQVDYFSVRVPANGAVEIDLAVNEVGGAHDIIGTLYDFDAETVLATSIGWPYFVAENRAGAAKTLFVRYAAESGSDTGYYQPFFASLGVDLDNDGYYDRDWAGYRDCNDANANIRPGATDAVGDSVDQNCDGADGASSLGLKSDLRRAHQRVKYEHNK